MDTYLKLGDWNAICDVCGFKYKASEMRRRWDGVYVCKYDWEPRHSQELVRVVPDNPTVPFTRPRPTDTFIGVCSLDGRSSIAGYSIAGCWIAGYPRLGAV